MDFKAVVENFKNIVTQKYFCFEGRANCAEFWQFYLVLFVISAVLGVIPKIGPILSMILGLALLCPALGVLVRRLHDRGKSGLTALLMLIPVAGPIIVLLLCIPAGDSGANAFGEPK